MACKDSNPHNAVEGCGGPCEPAPEAAICCPPRHQRQLNICPVVVPQTTPCQNRTLFHSGTNVNGGLCDCVCLGDEEVTFTEAQAAAITNMLNGIMQTLSPFPRCPDTCEILPQTGHNFPIKPSGDGCCGSTVADSPFLWSGGVGANFAPGVVSPFTDMDMGGGMQMHEQLGQIFCCAKKAISEATEEEEATEETEEETEESTETTD